MKLTSDWRVRTSMLGLLTVLALLATGCSLKLTVSDIPSPFADDMAYGQVIKEIRIEGNTVTDGDMFPRAMASAVGEIYTKETAALDAKWLTQLGVFTSVHFATIVEPDGIVLVVSVRETNPYIPSPSIKITEQNGLEIGVAISSPNLFGKADKASAYLRGGGATNAGANLTQPWLPGSSWTNRYVLQYFHVERFNKLYDFDESDNSINVTYVRNLTNSWRFGPRVALLSVGSEQPGITLDPDNHDNLPSAGLTLRFDNRNLQTYATGGWWTELLMTYTGGDASYWQGNLDLRRYFQLAGPDHSLALYALTTLTSGEVDVDIPIYMQFNIGGTNSVRGWGLGSREGKNQFLGTVEYWHVILELKRYSIWFIKQALGLQFSAFADVGTAWTTETEFRENWIGGGGVGIRLLTAAGLGFRFDVAAGQHDAGVRFFIGSQEKATAQRAWIR